jgi:hypothetical protein
MKPLTLFIGLFMALSFISASGFAYDTITGNGQLVNIIKTVGDNITLYEINQTNNITTYINTTNDYYYNVTNNITITNNITNWLNTSETDPFFIAENTSLWSAALDKYNATYAQCIPFAYNQTQPFTDWLGTFFYNYNQTYSGSTYNSTYAGYSYGSGNETLDVVNNYGQWFNNQTTPAISYANTNFYNTTSNIPVGAYNITFGASMNLTTNSTCINIRGATSLLQIC